MQIHDSDSFESHVLESKSPVLVDFYATWCEPCRKMDAILNDISSDGLMVAKIDIDQSQDLAVRYGVQSIPHFILFRKGEILGRMSGAMSKVKLKSFLTDHLT